MLNAKITAQGLLITADNEARRDISDLLRDDARGYPAALEYVADELRERFQLITAADIGALTDSPIFCAFDDTWVDDDGARHFVDGARVYWFPNYQLVNEFAALATRGRVLFAPALGE